MSIFEVVMLICFGAAWPFSIYKSYTSRENTGKSIMFLFILFVGYMAGMMHKLFYNFDLVILFIWIKQLHDFHGYYFIF